MDQTNNYSQLIDIDNKIDDDESDINQKLKKNLIDEIVMNTFHKIKQNKNKFLNLTIYSLKIDENINQQNYDIENIKFNLIVKINDIIVKGDLDSDILEVFYIFNIIKIIHNEILIDINYENININNDNDDNNKYIFQHNFLFENKNIEIFDFILNNDIAILIDNINNDSNNNINLLNIDLEKDVLFFHSEFLPNDFDININFNFINNSLNFDSIYFVLYKIRFKHIFIKIHSILFYILENLNNDDFFKYLFFKEFMHFFNIQNNTKNNKLIEFKEICLIEGEKINNKLNEFKEMINEYNDNYIIINYIKKYIVDFFDLK